MTIDLQAKPSISYHRVHTDDYNPLSVGTTSTYTLSTSSYGQINTSEIELEDVTIFKGDNFKEEYLSISKTDESITFGLNALYVPKDDIEVYVDDEFLHVNLEDYSDKNEYIFEGITFPAYKVKFLLSDKYNLADISIVTSRGLLFITVHRHNDKLVKRFTIDEI